MNINYHLYNQAKYLELKKEIMTEEVFINIFEACEDPRAGIEVFQAIANGSFDEYSSPNHLKGSVNHGLTNYRKLNDSEVGIDERM